MSGTLPGNTALNIIRSRRKTLCLQVSRPGQVIVRAPLRCSESKINTFVMQHQQWIEKQLDYHRNNPGLPVPEYRPNTRLWLLGKSYLIQWQYNGRNEIELCDSTLVVRSRKYEPERVAKRVEQWLREYALAYLSSRSIDIARSSPTELPPYVCKVRKMKRQWGNCSKKGEIKYNLSLIHYPIECIDYVIAHEMCHLLHFNHSKAFYALLVQICPDWRERKFKLETFSP